MNHKLLIEDIMFRTTKSRNSDRCCEKTSFYVHTNVNEASRACRKSRYCNTAALHCTSRKTGKKTLTYFRYKNAKYGLIIRGTLIKIELQHSGSNTMTFIISQRDRSCVLKFYSAQRSFFPFYVSRFGLSDARMQR